MLQRFLAICLIAPPWSVATAHAILEPDTVDDSMPMILFSGFGTAGVVHSSENRADYTTNIFKANGAGHTRNWSTDVDSIVGAQVIADVTSRLSATVQVTSAQRFDNTYKPNVTWANIKYAFSPDASIRLGRTVLPSFLYADSRNIGYANPWVRPPIELYSLVPVFSSDGVDASYRIHWGGSVHTLRGTFGTTHSDFPNGLGTATARREWNISDTVEYGAATLRVAYQRADLTQDGLVAFFEPFHLFGAQGDALVNKYSPDNKRLSFLGVGASYDPGNWFVTGEWGQDKFNSLLGNNSAWYLSAGYRLASFTPYATYASVKTSSSRSDPGLNLAGLPPPLAGLGAGLNGALNGILASIRPVQKTISVGARWDFVKDFDLKVQFDHIDIGAGSEGTLVNVQPDFVRGGTANIFSLSVDFVW